MCAGRGNEAAGAIGEAARMPAARQPGRRGKEMTVHGKTAYEEKTVNPV
jgi:hypothetical protein